MRIRRKSQQGQIAVHRRVLEDEGVGNGAEKLFGFLLVLLGATLSLSPLIGILDQFPHPLFIFLTLIGRERTAIDQQCPGQRAFFGLDHIAILGVNVVFFVEAVSPVGMIVVLGIQ